VIITSIFLYLGYTDEIDFWYTKEGPCLDHHALYIARFVSLFIIAITMISILRYLAININGNSKISRHKDPKFLFSWVFLIFNIDSFMFSAIKVSSYPDNIPMVGTDPFVTIIASLGPFLAHFGVVLYYVVVIKILKSFIEFVIVRDKEVLNRKFAVLTLFALTIPVLSFICCGVMSVGLIYPKYQDIYTRIYLIGAGVLTFFMGCLYVLLFYSWSRNWMIIYYTRLFVTMRL
jgi:hypothetical protein